MNRVSRAMVAAVGCLVLVGAAVAAHAQQDHFRCFKAKDAKTFKSATADLDALQSQFPDQNCTISGGAKEVCIPASKTNVVVEDGAHAPFPAQDLQFAQLCYKVKCPKVDVAPIAVTDQFGARQVQKFKAAKVCAPAVEQP